MPMNPKNRSSRRTNRERSQVEGIKSSILLVCVVDADGVASASKTAHLFSSIAPLIFDAQSGMASAYRNLYLISHHQTLNTPSYGKNFGQFTITPLLKSLTIPWILGPVTARHLHQNHSLKSSPNQNHLTKMNRCLSCWNC